MVPCDEEIWWILSYQGLCYRAAVAQERMAISLSGQTSSGSGLASQHGIDFSEMTKDIWAGDFPGRPLGDVVHPAFGLSYFPRISEDQLLSALQMWSDTIWLPDLKAEDWDFDHSTPVPLRTLNVSGCHFVTRNTIRRALQVAPSITRIIMIGCKSFGDTGFMLLSLDGTLNNIECILTSSTVRDPFQNPRHKIGWRNDAYNRALELLSQPPNEKIKAKLNSVPGVFFNSTGEFKFQYSTKVYDTYFLKGLSSRSLSHSLARPPALGFDPTSSKVVCGPPCFSIILATHSIADMPVTGATLPHVPIDTGIEGVGANGCGLTSIWRGIIDLLELLGQKWEKKSGLEGGGEFYGFPAYFKGGPGGANEEWIFTNQFRDMVARMQTCWANGSVVYLLVYPESSSQGCWGFIRYGLDSNLLSKEISTMVLYNVREFRQATCPDIPVLEDEAKWMTRVKDILTNGTWHPSYPIVNWELDRGMAHEGDPMWGKIWEAAKRMMRPKYIKDVPQELMLLMERMMICQMNAGKDPF